MEVIWGMSGKMEQIIWLVAILCGLLGPILMIYSAVDPLRRTPYAVRVVSALVVGSVVIVAAPAPHLEPSISLNVLVGTIHIAIGLALVRWLARRLIDTGHSAWWALIGYIPLVNFVAMVLMLFPKSRDVIASG